ncbi:MAG: L-histidine N(alpha)-methyltransferase [Myxococcota bacterium]|jgi:L-histidine N-alpha-methyltransferase
MSKHLSQYADRYRLTIPEAQIELTSFAEEVSAGLSAADRSLPCRFFYDEIGSKIFEEICDLEEYYLTRVERMILRERAADIAGHFDQGATLVEFGSGSAEKTRVLLEALLAAQASLVYVPIDISRSAIEESAEALLREHPRLNVHAVCGEYETALTVLGSHDSTPRLVLWLGSSVGNLDKPQAADFLIKVRAGMATSDRLLIGIDLRKKRERLERAYDDSLGVTARFNKNLLTRINRELGADFLSEQFEFRAHYHEDSGCVESSLVSLCDQNVQIAELGESFAFRQGDKIHTENSYKYSLQEIDELAALSQMRCETRWLDDDGEYSVNLLAPV